MKESEIYRRLAIACFDRARSSTNPKAAVRTFELSEYWLYKAKLAELETDLATVPNRSDG